MTERRKAGPTGCSLPEGLSPAYAGGRQPHSTARGGVWTRTGYVTSQDSQGATLPTKIMARGIQPVSWQVIVVVLLINLRRATFFCFRYIQELPYKIPLFR